LCFRPLSLIIWQNVAPYSILLLSATKKSKNFFMYVRAFFQAACFVNLVFVQLLILVFALQICFFLIVKLFAPTFVFFALCVATALPVGAISTRANFHSSSTSLSRNSHIPVIQSEQSFAL
jgi:hypothetical protein